MGYFCDFKACLAYYILVQCIEYAYQQVQYYRPPTRLINVAVDAQIIAIVIPFSRRLQ